MKIDFTSLLMSKFLKTSITALFFFVLVFSAFSVEAGIQHNVSGYAYSANIGPILLNSCGDPLDPSTCPLAGVDFGVNYDPNTGSFSGYGWNSAIGWINFSPSLSPGQGNYSNTSGKWARAELGALNVFEALGWTGWIDLDGVSLDTSTGFFTGYGWDGFNNDDDGQVDVDGGIGWVDFSTAKIVVGCTDPVASNYSSLAFVDDGSCLYLVPVEICDNGVDDDNDGLIDEVQCAKCTSGCNSSTKTLEVCTNPLAINYYPVISSSNANQMITSNSSLCVLVSGVCGDGIKEVAEQCDDGNVINGDGCSSQCIIENGPVSGQPGRIIPEFKEI